MKLIAPNMLELDPATEYNLLPPHRLVFSSPAGQFTIVDKAGLIRAVLKCLEEGVPVARAFERIGCPEHASDIEDKIIALLKQRGVVRSQQASCAVSGRDDLFNAWLRFAGQAQETQPIIGVLGEGLLATALLEELQTLGLSPMRADKIDPKFDLIASCQDYENMQKLREINRQAIDAGTVLYPVRLQRHIVALGPVIIPEATACMECFHHRRRMNFPADAASLEADAAHAVSPFVARFGAMLATIEIARYFHGATYDLHVATLTRQSALTGKRTQSVVLKLPRCPACGMGRGQRPLVDTFARDAHIDLGERSMREAS